MTTPSHSGGTDPSIVIRPMGTADVPGIHALLPRFAGDFLPAWVAPEDIRRMALATLEQACAAPPADSALFVAEAADGVVAGFIHLQTHLDAFSGEPVGYVSDLAVGEPFEGRGIARRLLATAEAWSRERDHRLLTLNVFAGNARALDLYRACGYQPEVLKMAKPVTGSSSR